MVHASHTCVKDRVVKLNFTLKFWITERTRNTSIYSEDLTRGNFHFWKLTLLQQEPGYLSLYSDCLRTGWPGNCDSIPGRWKRFLSSPQVPDQFCGLSMLRSNGQTTIFPRLRRHGREADHSVPSTVDVKNAFSSTFTPTHVYTACWLIT
jgi:hypothetical protein